MVPLTLGHRFGGSEVRGMVDCATGSARDCDGMVGWHATFYTARVTGCPTYHRTKTSRTLFPKAYVRLYVNPKDTVLANRWTEKKLSCTRRGEGENIGISLIKSS